MTEASGTPNGASWIERLVPIAIAIAILAGAIAVRWDSPSIRVEDRLHVFDPDTVRRLVRLEAIDASDTYPLVETKDGYPNGTIIHWTLPMDWVLRTLNPIAGMFFPGARGYEPAVLLAGPVLGAAATLLMLVGCVKLFGAFAGLAIAMFYAFSATVINSTALGIGDHQNLQHLAIVGATLAFFGFVKKQSTRALPILAGACLGLAVWVSTETMLFVYLWSCLAIAHLLVAEDEPLARKQHMQASIALLATLCIGHLFEHRDNLLAVELDKLSLLHVIQGSVLVVFVALTQWLPIANRLPRVAAAAGLAAVLGVAPFALSGFRETLVEQFDRFATINVWLQTEIAEFKGLFETADGRFQFMNAIMTESWLLLGLPLFIAGVLLSRRLSRPASVGLVILTIGTFCLTTWELKLGHFFAIVFPITIVCGAQGILARFAGGLSAFETRGLAYAGFAVLGWCALTTLPPKRSETPQVISDGYIRRLCHRLNEHTADDKTGAVLAEWDMGAHIMYYAGLPVVASGYHRNIQGILDANFIYLAGRNERAKARRLMRDRKVRWVLAGYSQSFFATAPQTLGRTPLAEWTDRGLLVQDAAAETLFWDLRFAPRVPEMKLVEEGPEVTVAGVKQNMYRIYDLR